MLSMETLIITHLLHDEEYMRKVLPFLAEEYFINSSDRKIISYITNFVEMYGTSPTVEALTILLQKENSLNEGEYNNIIEILDQCHEKSDTNLEFMIKETEAFCKQKAVYNAILQSIRIHDGSDTKMTVDAIPSLLQNALSVGFDNSVGHDYIEDADRRHEFYNRTEERVPCDLTLLNIISRGGIPRKTLNMIVAGIHVGKSLMMCHLAAAYKTLGHNVLYITLEMSQEQIAERIDANLMNVDVDDLAALTKNSFQSRIEKIRGRSEGVLIIKEFPTSSAHVGHFRALLTELRTKKNFVPDVILVDYVNLCASSRIKLGSPGVNSYTYIKAVSEELRGLAVEKNAVLWSGTQLTRSGLSSTDPNFEDTAESIGLPATADFMISGVRTEELDKLGQILIKQLKNRYRDMSVNKRFVLGLDRPKMRLYDVDQSGQRDVMPDPHHGDQNNGQNGLIFTSKPTTKDFSGFKT